MNTTGNDNSSGARVSVIVPIYRSEATLATMLASLEGQSFRDFEAILVDSSPTDACASLAAKHPSFLYRRSPQRLWPQEARQMGISRSRGQLLVFTDPDVVLEPGWLENLIATHDDRGGAVVAAVACEGNGWFDRGVHFVKFSKWLPAGAVRPVDMGPTVGLLCSRVEFDRVGGFGDQPLLGDARLSWFLRQAGVTLWLDPRAVVRHRHEHGWRSFLRERFTRGRDYGVLRPGQEEWSRGRTALMALATLALLRWGSAVGHTLRHAVRAGQAGSALLTLPVVLAGHGASSAGEALGLLTALISRRGQPS